MTPLRIVMVAPTPFFSDRGCHVRILEEARALQELGAEVTICTYFLGNTPEGLSVRRGIRFPGYSKRSAGPSWTKPFMDIDLWRLVFQVVREKRPHILHAHLHEGMAIAAGIPGHASMARIFDYQGSLSQELRDHGLPKWLVPFFRRVEKGINNRPHHIFTSHTQAAEHLTRDFGISPDRITVTQDAGTLPPVSQTRVEELRRQWGLSMETPILLYTGLLGTHQGTPLLMDLGKAIKAQGLDATILVCGYPESRWRQRALECGLGEIMKFTGRFAYEDYTNILRLGTLAVSPKTSTTEGNQKLYAYLQAGLPIVAFNTPVNRTILEDAGILIDSGDHRAFVTEILELLGSPESRARYGDLAIKQAVEHGSWTDVGRCLLKVYRKP